MSQDFLAALDELRAQINAQLSEHLAQMTGRHGPVPPSLVEACRYALLGGGKRIRPALALAACQAVGGDRAAALPLGCALEMIHAYSLVHDDLPSMDDDDERRGQPTVHIKYDEPTAILVGDALQAEAFRALTAPGQGLDPAVQLELVRMVAEAAGAAGMVGGQQYDIEAADHTPTLEGVGHLHAMKTGALFLAAVLGGGLAGGASPEQMEHLETYGRAIGRAFQVVDDLLDLEGQETSGDAHEDAVNLAVHLGPEEARYEASRLTQAAREAAQALGGDFLLALADYLETRNH
jgi:geranylgeranyl diphosphate synthase type II